MKNGGISSCNAFMYALEDIIFKIEFIWAYIC